MAQTQALIDKYLTQASNMYKPEGYIGDMIFPQIGVVQSSGKLAGYGKDHIRVVNTTMGGRGKAPQYTSITRNSDTYVIEDHGLTDTVTKNDYDNVETPYDAEKDTTLGLTLALKTGREKAIADALGSTSIITQNETLSGTSQFSDYVNSDPLTKFKDAQQAVYDGSGMPPNLVIMSWDVANTLQYHPGILDGLGFNANRAGTLTEQELAAAMKVQRILVGSAKYNSANLGQTDNLASIWGKNIVFAHVPMSAQKYQVSLGYHIKKSNETPYQVYKQATFNPPNGSDVLVTNNYDDLLSNVNAAYLIKDAIA